MNEHRQTKAVTSKLNSYGLTVGATTSVEARIPHLKRLEIMTLT